MKPWSFRILDIPLKHHWKIHHGSAMSKPVGIVALQKDGFVGFGEVAEATGSGLMATYQDQFANIEFPESLEETLSLLRGLKVSSPLKVGIETAFLRWQSLKKEKSFYKCLGRKVPEEIPTSYSVPILQPAEVDAYIQKFQLHRFSSLKIKVSGPKDLPMVKEVGRCFAGQLRIDANESFQTVEEVLKFIKAIEDLPIEFLEQPLSRTAVDGSMELKAKAGLPIVGDESLQSEAVTEDLAAQFDAVNIKVMKAGGIIQAKKQIEQARDLNLKVMLGCMVETSLGISTAFALVEGIDWYDLDGFLLLAEDPFGLIVEEKGRLRLSDTPKNYCL